MQLELFKSSWATNEGFETLRNQLDDLVPLSGRCKNPRSTNKKLDKFRVAQNLIHDLFNNGLCNRKAHFRQFFGWAPIGFDFHINEWKRFEEELEPTFTQIIQEAANEQKRLGNL
tara:strand:- start:4101 stop:4445 length:345 start_codon:yes stop_codon:yes gene_type:complete